MDPTPPPPRFPTRSEGPLAFLKRLVFGAPDDPSQFDRAPDGLALVHIASDETRAEMLREVLAAEGFAVEFVPSKWGGIVGIRGSDEIYVPRDQLEAAKAFVADYLSAVPEPGWEDAALRAEAPEVGEAPEDR